MQRVSVFVYGLFSYLFFLAIFAYSILFIGNFGLERSMDGSQVGTTMNAALVNLALLCVFAIQHSVMARPGFKHAFTKLIPDAAERSTYVLLSSAALALLYWQWRPMEASVWVAESEVIRVSLNALYLVGWGVVFYATILISHFDLFGMRQVWLFAKNEPYTQLPFATPSLYKHIRHPLYVGWLIVFWSAPTMSLGHLLFAAVTTGYILVAIQLEERDLVTHLGTDYENYRAKVPMLFPRLRKTTT